MGKIEIYFTITLPFSREIDHHITLKEGSKPYHYAHFEKEDMKK